MKSEWPRPDMKLTVTQRAVLAYEYWCFLDMKFPDTPFHRAKAAEWAGIGEASLGRVRRIAEHDEQLMSRIRSGELTPSAAERELLQRQPRLKFAPAEMKEWLPPKGSPPPVTAKGPTAARYRRMWIEFMAKDSATSEQIADRLGTSEHYIRLTAREYGIAIPADKFILKRRRGNFDVNRVAQVIADDLTALDISIERVKAATGDLDPSKVEQWAAVYREIGNRLYRLSKRMEAKQ